MSRTGLWLAAAVVVASNLVALGLAGVNRQGEPEATLQLTEREVSPISLGTQNSAMTLRLNWTDAGEAHEAGWFDRAKLSELGFDCREPVTRENARHYRAMPPRTAYVAMEYDGPAWQRYAASLPASAGTATDSRVSHLVPVDVAPDATRLRARYPDRTRVVITHAVVDVSVIQERGRPLFLKGRIVAVLPAELNVPRNLRRTIEPLVSRIDRARSAGQPGAVTPAQAALYRATVLWGRHLEPWIAAVHAPGR